MTAKTYTAHPKVDVLMGETMAYGMVWRQQDLGNHPFTIPLPQLRLICSRANDLVYYRFNKEGKKVDECWLKTPNVM